MPRRPRRPAVPPEIKRVLDRFEDWRQTKRARERIPDPLWAAAARLCVDYSVHRVSKWLRLNHTSLKSRVEAATVGHPRSEKAASTFVEVVHAAEPSSPECVVELEDARGAKMKIHLKGAGIPDLAAVTRLFWSRA